MYDYVTSLGMDRYLSFQQYFDKIDKDKKNKRAKLTIDYKLLPHDKAKEKDDQFNYNEVVYCEECNFEWTNETDDD